MSDPTDTSQGVRATLQYLASSNGAAYHASEGGGEAANHDGDYDFREVFIANARRSNAGFDLDREGFCLVPHVSKVRDFYNDAHLADVYNKEVEELIKRVTGGRRVHVFDHTRRASSAEVRRTVKSREPSSVIHNDYTEKSATKRLFDLLGDEAEALAKGRFAIINVWRSIAGTVRTSHLAFCDSTSLKDGDLLAVQRVAKDRIGEIQMALFNSMHRWYYFPEMTENECCLIKTYDSNRDGVNRFTIHTAFQDPTAHSDAEPRQSVETRAFVFY